MDEGKANAAVDLDFLRGHGFEDAANEIERLRGALEAVTTFHQVTHCHAAARAGLAGLPVGEKPSN